MFFLVTIDDILHSVFRAIIREEKLQERSTLKYLNLKIRSRATVPESLTAVVKNMIFLSVNVSLQILVSSRGDKMRKPKVLCKMFGVWFVYPPVKPSEITAILTGCPFQFPQLK